MTLSSRTPMLRALKGFDADIKPVFRAASDQIGARLLSRVVSGESPIPVRDLPAIQRNAGAIIERVFVSADGRNAFGADGRTPLSPYATVLNQWAVTVTTQIVRQHGDFMRSRLPEDVARWLEQGRRTVAEQFSPQALVEYESLWDWQDERGYVLSDRIWRTSTATRARLDAFLADHIRRGTGALRMSRLLEQFLVPGRAAIRTTRPYGSDASFDAMRLARTEITRQAGQVFLAASRSNPFVEAIVWNLSGSHPKPDECDTLAEGSPYPVDNVPSYPGHPQCLCFLTTQVRPASEVIEELRAQMQEGQDAPLTPVNETGFLEALLGALLAALALREAVL